MRIGIDIDETIAATFDAVLGFAKSRNPILSNFRFDMLSHHDWWLIPEMGIGKEETMSFFHEYERCDPGHLDIVPVDHSVEGIRFLKSRWYELSAITGRTEKLIYRSTMDWLDRHFSGAFSSVAFTNHNSQEKRRHKSEVCKELGINLMIEDNFDFALELAENGIASYVLEKPWNRHRTETHPNIKRVADWRGIISDIEKTHV